ncbi:MAG: tetratricopeptide repeat protein [Planctomycetes bacterium]|nr:tetratricopeptide repeat protein [Planctomycetota bacterium]
MILTGKPPFLGETALGTVLKAARAEVAGCHAQLDACGADAELVAVAKKCLAARPADRYANGEDVAAEVAAYRAGVERRLRAAERDRAVSAAEAREQRKRRKVQLALAGVVALVLAAGGTVAWYEDRRAAQRERADELAEADRKAERRREEVERAAERRMKAEQARRSVATDLRLAADLRGQYKFREAGAALAQAAEQAAGGAPERLGEVERARADLAFVVRLDDIRFRKWLWVPGDGGTGHFNEEAAPPEYRRAFAEHGSDLARTDPAEAARRIAASEVRAELVAAVDDWALYEPDAAWADGAAVARLAADVAPAAAPAALSVLATLMARQKLDPSPVLSAARARHPTDFELAFVLGRWHTLNGADGREIGPYEAARALRPGNVTVWLNLGCALHGRGDRDGALAAWREAVRLDPADAIARYDLGWALYDRGDVPGAVAAFEEAIRLDPKYARAHYELGVARNRRGDVAGAIRAWKEAARYDPRDPRATTNIGVAYAQQGKYPDALGCARAAIDADPKYANAHALLGIVLQQTGDVPGARAALTEAARLDPKKWGGLIANLPPLPLAPPPREVNRPFPNG